MAGNIYKSQADMDKAMVDLYGENDAPVETPAADLELKKKQVLALASARARAADSDAKAAKNTDYMPNENGILATIGKSGMGRVVGGAIDSTSDAMGNMANMLGANYKDKVASPDLDKLRELGWSGTDTPTKWGAVEESLMNSPPGKVLGMFGANPIAATVGTGLSYGNEGLESLGIPHQYSQAAESLLPFLLKSKGVTGASILGDENTFPPGGAGGPPPSGPWGNIPPETTGILPKLTEMISQRTDPMWDKAADTAATLKAKLEPLLAKEVPPPIHPTLTKGANSEPLLVTPKSLNASRDLLLQVLKDDGITPDQIADNLEKAKTSGKPLTALDVATKELGGVQTQGGQLMAIAKAAAKMPGQGSSMAGEVAARGLKASDRIGEDFDAALSKSPFYDIKEDAIQQQHGSGQHYQDAYKANPSVTSPEINSILNTPTGSEALKAAVRTMQDNRSHVGVNNPDLVEQAALTGEYVPGDGGIAAGLKMKTLDLVKQHMWDIAENKKHPMTGRDTTASSAIKGQMRSLTNELDKLDSTVQLDPETGAPIPGTGSYSKGRKSYSTGARQESALTNGREFMSMDPEEIQKFMSDENVSDPEKLAFSAGVRRAIQDRIDNTNDGSNPINKVWRQNVRARIRPLFSDEESFNNFEQSMQHEQTMARINNNYKGGSDTAPNLQHQGAIGAVSKAYKAATNPAGFAVDSGMEVLNNKLKASASKMSKETAAGIVRYLTTDDPEVWRELGKK